MAEKQYTLEAVQGRLKQQKSKAMIFLRGEDNIWVRGTFPPRPGSDKTRACQDKFSLHLPANRDGFKAAEREALRISALIIAKQFDWRDFLNPADQPDFKHAQMWIQEFADEYKSTHTISNHTFNQQWMRIYKKLPQDKPITKEILIAVALQAEKNSRDRKKRCEKLQKLADFIGIVVDLKQYAGKYQVKDRDIPDDLTIAQMWQSIPTAAWRWMYGVIAAYGVRPHEAFFSEWTEEGLLVTRGKTGPRLVFEAIYPEWASEWKLSEVIKPNIDASALVTKCDDCFERLGYRVTKQLKRYGCPFTAYDLRHAYAIRASVTFELPVTTAAALMGHSPDIHLKKYHKHIQLAQNQAASKRIMSRPDRPKPPHAGQGVEEDAS